MLSRLFTISALCVALVGTSVGAQPAAQPSEQPAAAETPPPPPPPPYSLFVLRSGSTTSQRCARTDTGYDIVSALTRIVIAKLKAVPSFPVATAVDAATLVLLAGTTPLTSPQEVVIATYCKSGDVYNVTITGYYISSEDQKTGSPGSVEAGPPLSGTLDVVASADWSALFGQSAPQLVSNVAFWPVANDTSGIVNARLERNLPITQIQTPAPAPTATPAPGNAAVPTTRYEACLASPDRMLVSGRTIILSNPNVDNISKLLVGAVAIKQSAPNPWGALYTGLGTGLAYLYGPNRAEVGADVFVCPGDQFIWVGGHSIVGHASTPLFNPSAEDVQRALDLAALDLENQLACIMDRFRPDGTDSIINLGGAIDEWCRVGVHGKPAYWTTLTKGFPYMGLPAGDNPIDASIIKRYIKPSQSQHN